MCECYGFEEYVYCLPLVLYSMLLVHGIALLSERFNCRPLFELLENE